MVQPQHAGPASLDPDGCHDVDSAMCVLADCLRVAIKMSKVPFVALQINLLPTKVNLITHQRCMK